VNGLQWSVVAFFTAIWAALAAILVVAPGIYSLALGSVPPASFFAAISLLIAACVVGVARRWRWAFWLILVAFLAGAFRVIASALQLGGALPIDNPTWYIALQGAIGIVQLTIGIAMLRAYRRAGIWGRATER